MRPLLAIVLLCLVACGDASSGKSPLACFDEIGEASLQQVVCLDSIGAFSVTDFVVDGDVLWLLFQRPGSEDVLTRYGIGDNSYECLIKRGRGPGEMITVTPLDGNRGIHLAECNANVLMTVLRDSVSGRRLPSGGLVSCITDGERVISTGNYPGGRYRLADLHSGKVSYFGEYPQGKRRIGDDLVATAYINSKLAMKPDHSRFVCVNSNCGVIEINAVEGDSIRNVRQVVFHYPDVVRTSSGGMNIAAIRKSNINGFFDVTCSDEYIYTLYSGRSFYEAGLNLDKCDYLIVFDWTGEPVACLHLSPAFTAIHFDSGHGVLYGLADDVAASFIYKLNMGL